MGWVVGSPSSDKALIVSVANESYLAVDKGPISDDHVLIIPTHHYPSTLRVSERYVDFFSPYDCTLSAVVTRRWSCI